ncbi:S-layer homology domain-containing protein [Bacillus massiliigorillae]|uniref:S-layer homology domain-containing protein n=1 Tax=Bacillus massiliigorillae TaxID=1243664 RepID=UPI0003A03526|nr:S-layer homology domain-containing protein [Bacillus massiliigorillae]
MKRVSRSILSFILIFALFMSLAGSPSSAAQTDQVHYLSIGDSLAKGQTPDKKIDLGFSDFTANTFKEKSILGSYSKDFADSGDKTTDVLNKLTTDSKLQEAVKKANLITISAGANDILQEAKIDLAAGTITFDVTKLPAKLQEVATNYAKILGTIKALNPEAKVYVMGIYFPFPYLPDQAQVTQLASLAKTLNKTVSEATILGGATFVSVYEQMGGDDMAALKKNLPNATDIHPNIDGYKIMSAALLEAIAKQITPEPNPEPKPEPTVPADIKGHWAEKELSYLVSNNVLSVDEKGFVYPDKAITRAEVAMILYSSIPMTKEIPVDPGYKDVPKNHPAYMAIAKLTALGVFTKAEKFNPNDSLTRIQLAKVVSTAFKLKAEGKPVVFKDVPKTYWGYNAVQAVATNKLMLGSNGSFDLYSSTTRGQFAAVAVRALQSVAK